MALIVTGLKRVFKMKQKSGDVILEDPNPNFTPAEVLNFYSTTHPALTTSTIAEPKVENEEVIYEFTTTVGTKG